MRNVTYGKNQRQNFSPRSTTVLGPRPDQPVNRASALSSRHHKEPKTLPGTPGHRPSPSPDRTCGPRPLPIRPERGDLATPTLKSVSLGTEGSVQPEPTPQTGEALLSGLSGASPKLLSLLRETQETEFSAAYSVSSAPGALGTS